MFAIIPVMVKWVYRVLHLAIFAVAFASFGVVINSASAFAAGEGPNEFPGIQTMPGSTTGPSWGFSKISPDPDLTYWFNNTQTTRGGGSAEMVHVLRNTKYGRNIGTHLRVYYAGKPSQVTFNVNVTGCQLDNDLPYAGNLIVRLGGKQLYNQPTRGFEIDSEDRRFEYGPANNTSLHFKDNNVTDKHRRAFSPVCANAADYNYAAKKFEEGCSSKSGSLCRNAGNGSFSYVSSGSVSTSSQSSTANSDMYDLTHVSTINGARIGNIYSINNKLDNRQFTLWTDCAAHPTNCVDSASSGIDPDTGMYYADLDVDLTADADIPSTQEHEIDFIVTALNDTATGRVPKLGYRAEQDPAKAAKYFGLLGKNTNGSSSTWGVKAAIPFGTPCNGGDIDKPTIVMYDADNNRFGEVYMAVFKRNPATGAVTRLPVSPTTTDPDGTVWHGAYEVHNGGADPKNWNTAIAASGSRLRSTSFVDRQNSTFRLKKIEHGYQYMLVFSNPNQYGPTYGGDPRGNIYSLKLPTDSILGLVNCQFKLTPSISVSPGNFSYKSTLNPTGSISGNGNTSGTHVWRITRAVFTSKPSNLGASAGTATSPCGYMSSINIPTSCTTVQNYIYPTDTNDTPPDAVGPYPPGTYVCYMTSVKYPKWDGSPNDWAHSSMVCAVSGTLPKVQAWGYDVKADGVIGTTTNQDDTGKTFGSWGEYGVFSDGLNGVLTAASISMASGAGFNNGAANPLTLAAVNKLTFAQPPSANPCGVSKYGCFGGLNMPSLAELSAGAIDIAGTDKTATSLSDNIFPAATATGQQKGIIRVHGTLTINANLTYPATAHDITQLSRVVIVADDIVIGPGVTQIDPWLIAAGPNNNGAGRISTCSDVRSGANFFVAMSSANLDTSKCINQLRFNGPVVASKIYLYRTHDSATGEPAEIFNLRADNFLASYVGGGPNQPVATTDSITEVPPRF